MTWDGLVYVLLYTSLPIKINQIWVNIRYTCGFARFVVPIFRKVLLGYEVIFFRRLGGGDDQKKRVVFENPFYNSKGRGPLVVNVISYLGRPYIHHQLDTW